MIVTMMEEEAWAELHPQNALVQIQGHLDDACRGPGQLLGNDPGRCCTTEHAPVPTASSIFPSIPSPYSSALQSVCMFPRHVSD